MKRKKQMNDVVVVDRNFMKIAQQAIMICAHLLDDWEEFFPAMHLIWDKHANDVFPYEICQHLEDMRDVLLELEQMAGERISETMVSGVVGEA